MLVLLSAVCFGTTGTAQALGPDVIALKKLLRAWGKEHPLPKPLKLTPLFGPATTEAVKAFQKANGIEQTGRIDKATVAALNAPEAAEKQRQAARRGQAIAQIGERLALRALALFRARRQAFGQGV